MWLFSLFMEGWPKRNLVNKLGDGNDSLSKVSERLSSYTTVINYLLNHSASDDIIADADQRIKSLRQLPDQDHVKFAEVISAKALRCGHVYTETTLIMIFIDGLDSDIKGQVRRYWSENRRTTYASLERYTSALVTQNQEEVETSTRSTRSNTTDTRRPRWNDNRHDTRQDSHHRA